MDDLTRKQEEEVIRAALEFAKASNYFEAKTKEDIIIDWKDYFTAEKNVKVKAKELLATVNDLSNYNISTDERIIDLRNSNQKLRENICVLREELRTAYRNNETRNKELDALHYVWCDGGCDGGVHRYCKNPEEITEEIVALAERNTKRLRSWFCSHNYHLSQNYRLSQERLADLVSKSFGGKGCVPKKSFWEKIQNVFRTKAK